jgi:hypothetical protein
VVFVNFVTFVQIDLRQIVICQFRRQGCEYLLQLPGFDHEEFEWDLLGLNSSVSLPPRELLDLADQLDVILAEEG